MIHEISHGSVALFFGDKTALYEGRLTLNPLKHIDWFGSVFLPIFLVLIKAGFIIGWAKPVPYNPYNLKNRQVAEPLISLAGPVSNLLVATIFGMVIRGLLYFGFSNSPLISIFGYVVMINVALALFNLIPIPPLDGSKIFFSFLPADLKFKFFEFADRYGLILLIVLVTLLPGIVTPAIQFVFSLLTGIK